MLVDPHGRRVQFPGTSTGTIPAASSHGCRWPEGLRDRSRSPLASRSCCSRVWCAGLVDRGNAGCATSCSGSRRRTGAAPNAQICRSALRRSVLAVGQAACARFDAGVKCVSCSRVWGRANGSGWSPDLGSIVGGVEDDDTEPQWGDLLAGTVICGLGVVTMFSSAIGSGLAAEPIDRPERLALGGLAFLVGLFLVVKSLRGGPSESRRRRRGRGGARGRRP